MMNIIIATVLQSNANIAKDIAILKQDNVIVKTFTNKTDATHYIENLKTQPFVTVKKTQSLKKPLDYSDITGGSYNKGFKYYSRYIYRTSHIRSTEILSKIGVQLPSQLKILFGNNAQGLIAKLNQAGFKKVTKGVKKIARIHKLNDLYKFLVGILNGKIPASCG